MKILNINLSALSSDEYLRSDFKYYNFVCTKKWNVFDSKSSNLIPLFEILHEEKNKFDYKDEEEYYGVPTGSSYIDEYGKIVSTQMVTKDDHPNRLKYQIDGESILLSSLRLAKVPSVTFENLDYDKYVFSNGFYILKNKSNWNKKFLMYLLRMPHIKKVLDNNIYRGIGISNFKIEDFLKIKIPNVPQNIQQDFCDEIKEIESKIDDEYVKVNGNSQIINEILSKHFAYDSNLLTKLEKGMTYGTQSCPDKSIGLMNLKITEFVNDNTNIRFSYRSKNRLLNEIVDIIKNKSYLKIKDITLSIEKGVQPEYADFGVPVIKIANLKNEYINTDFEEFANETYCNKLKKEKFVKINDILICSIGKGSLGKVDLVEEEIEAILSVDNYMLRIDKEKYLPEFLTYYLRSIFGISQFELNYSGATNQIHIYDYDILDFIIPNISIDKQQVIVDEIRKQIKIQQKRKKEIKEKSYEILNILKSKIIDGGEE